MSKLNSIGLNTVKAKILSENLNDLLANYSLFYQNVRGFHWNIQGQKFFELHLKFEELYNNLVLKIDEIAERILTLEDKPEHRFSAYLKISEIKEKKEVKDGISAIHEILASFKIIIFKQRAILKLAEEINDEGTNATMSDYIREQEKMTWMYNAFLK
jgi:starvation-inducible DNA-binding protein